MIVEKYEPDHVITSLEDVTYVSFIVARLAAQKGYDVFCQASWTNYLQTTEYYKKDDLKFEIGSIVKGRNSHHKEFNNEYYNIYAAPSQESLKGWLRIVHGIEVEIHYNKVCKLYQWKVFWTKGGKFIKDSIEENSIYEIAFERALRAALNKLEDKN